MNHPNYAAEVVSVNADGTVVVRYICGFPCGGVSRIKKSTLAPPDWSDAKIIDTTHRVGDTPSRGTRPADGATFHRDVVDGVTWDVIKDPSGNVVSSYPSGGTSPPTGFV